MDDALISIRVEAARPLGDPGAAVQQKVEFRSQQSALRRGEILQGAGAHQAVEAVDVALQGTLSVVGPLPQDQLEAAGQNTTDLHQDVQVPLGVSGYVLGSLELSGEHLVELFGRSLCYLLAGISGIAGDPRSGLARAFRCLANGFPTTAAGRPARLRRIADGPRHLAGSIPDFLARAAFPCIVRHHQLLSCIFGQEISSVTTSSTNPTSG